MSHAEQKDGFGFGCCLSPQAQGACFAGKPQLSKWIQATLVNDVDEVAWLEGPAQPHPSAGSSLLLMYGGVLAGPMASSPPTVNQAG